MKLITERSKSIGSRIGDWFRVNLKNSYRASSNADIGMRKTQKVVLTEPPVVKAYKMLKVTRASRGNTTVFVRCECGQTQTLYPGAWARHNFVLCSGCQGKLVYSPISQRPPVSFKVASVYREPGRETCQSRCQVTCECGHTQWVTLLSWAGHKYTRCRSCEGHMLYSEFSK
jgi:hypothetical protein